VQKRAAWSVPVLANARGKKRTRFATIQAAFAAVLIASIVACAWLLQESSNAYQADHATRDRIAVLANMGSESLRLCDRLFLDVHQGIDENQSYWQEQYHEDVVELRSYFGRIAGFAVTPLPADMPADNYWALNAVEEMDAQIFAFAVADHQEAGEEILSSPDYIAVRGINEQRLKALLRVVSAQTDVDHQRASAAFQSISRLAVIFASLLALAWIAGLLILRRWVVRENAAERWAIQAAETRFQTLSEASPIGVWYGDAEGKIIYVNPEMQRIAGAPSRDALMGTGWMDRVHPEDIGELHAKLMSVLGTANSTEATFRILPPDGSTRWIQLRAVPIFDATRQPTGQTGTIVDITDAREAKAHLQESEARYRSVLNEQREMLSRFDGDTTILYANRANAELFGTTQEAIVGTRWIDIIPEDQQAVMLESTRNILSTNIGMNFDWPFPQPDGTPRWIHFELRPMTDPTTGVQYIQSVGTDVTEARQLSASLQESEARYRSVVDGQKEMLSRYDADTTLSFVNLAYAEMFGKSKEELIGLRWIELVPEDGRELLRNYIQSVMESGIQHELDRPMGHPDGSLRWIHFKNNRMTDPITGEFFIQSVGTDITEARALAASLQASEARYRSVVDEQKELLSRYDADTTILFANRAYAEMFSSTQEAILGTHWLDVIPDSRKAELLAYVQDVLNSESGIDIEWPLTHPDGSLHWFHFVNKPMTDPITGARFVQSIATDITEARVLSQSLQASEARYRSVVDEQKELLSRYDEDTTILFVNKAYAEIFGTTAEELLGTRWIDLIPVDDREYMLDYVKRVLASESRQEIEWPLPHPDGTLRQIRFEDRRMTDPVTGEFFVQSVGTDITESLAAAAKLQASEVAYRSVLDEQKEVICRYDADTTIRFVNRAYARMFDTTPEALIGTRWIDGIPEYQRATFRAYVKRVFLSEARQEIEWPLPHPDGTLRYIRFEDRRMTDPVTGEFFVQSVGTDITESLAAAAKLQASEAKYRSALDEQKDMLFRWKPDTTVFFVNRAWREFFQIDLEANPGWRWMLTVPEEGRATILEHQRHLFAGEPVPPFEWQIPDPSGSLRWISFQDQLMTDEITGETFVQSVGSDVTERRQHLLDLERYTSALLQSQAAEAKHAARLSQTITELDEARRRAEEGTRAKSAFLANMSHELRTPLNAILGYSEMLSEDAAADGNDSAVADLGRILQSGRHLLGLINDILDLSKVEAGHMELIIEELSLTELIREIEHTAIPLARQHSNAFEAICEPNLGIVWTDVVRVRQILINLLGNAFKFTENGLVTLRVSRQITDGRDEFVLAVGDSGIGIAPADADRLFQEFTQADVSTTRRYGGTGLGLTLTKRFVELLHGNITVRSELGQGATFTVVLPASQPDPSTTNRPRSIETRPRLTNPSLAPMPVLEAIAGSIADSLSATAQPLVLVIDDDPVVGELLGRQLEPEGYRVEVALSGADGLIKARALQPSLVTLDLMMPEMDGWEVLATMKHDPALAGIPVIIISILNDRQSVMSLGACDALVKPVSPEQLLPVMARHQRLRLTQPVLIVDDDALVRNLLRRSLEQEGWRVIEATNGLEALEQMALEAPALILLDLMMPVMDGFEFLAQVRLEERYDQLPIVVLTAMDLTTAQREFLHIAARGLLQKSQGMRREVVLEIKRVLDRPPAVNFSGYEGAFLA